MPRLPLALLACAAAGQALADPPRIRDATARQGATGWTVSVTLAHPDTGWEHYADGWRAETTGGTVLGTRELLHPHVDEQPFTRALRGVAIPQGTATLLLRARCNVDGWSDETFALTLAD